MITITMANGDIYSCVRHDHDHKQRGRNEPCMACKLEQKNPRRTNGGSK